jgi:hypothetical protein
LLDELEGAVEGLDPDPLGAVKAQTEVMIFSPERLLRSAFGLR